MPTIGEIVEARGHLYAWIARPDTVSPVQDYGLSPEDMNPATILTWTDRDGQVLTAFLTWWQAKGYQGVAPGPALTEPALVALREFTAQNMAGAPAPQEPTATPSPVLPGYVNPSGELPPPPPVEPPPPTGPLPPPPPTVPETPAAKKEKSNTWLWALGLAAVVVGGYAVYGKKRA